MYHLNSPFFEARGWLAPVPQQGGLWETSMVSELESMVCCIFQVNNVA